MFELIFFAILIPEADPAICNGCDARVGDSHPVSVSGQIFKDMLRISNGFPDTDDPFVFIESVFELLVVSLNIQFSTSDSPCEEIDELTPKDQGEGFLVKEVLILARDPLFALFIDSASNNEAVEVKVGLEQLIPGVQYSHKTQFTTKLVFPELEEGLGGSLKECGEHHRFVFQDDRVQLMWEGEDEMEVGFREEF